MAVPRSSNQVIDGTLKYLTEGAGWTKGAMQKSDNGPACLVGAATLVAANHGITHYMKAVEALRFDPVLKKRLNEALRKIAIAAHELYPRTTYAPPKDRAQDPVVHFNDNKYRTKAQIVKVLERAKEIKLAK